MKQFVLLTALIFSITFCEAQIRKVPATVTEAFKEHFPGASNVSWKDKITGFEASFNLEGSRMYAKFNNDAEWEKTETVFKYEELNDDVKNGFRKSKYNDWEIKDVRKVESKEHGILYKIEVKKNAVQKKNLLFNETGVMQKDNITI